MSCDLSSSSDSSYQLGDLGDVAQSFRRNQRLICQPTPLTVRDVFKTLQAIAKEGGAGSSARRKALMTKLLRSCREQETRYIVRTLLQVSSSLPRALDPPCAAHAHRYEHDARAGSTGDRIPSGARQVHQAGGSRTSSYREAKPSEESGQGHYQVLSPHRRAAEARGSCCIHCLLRVSEPQWSVKEQLDDVDASPAVLVPALLEGGIDHMVKTCTVTPGTPFKPMLAKVPAFPPQSLW